MQPDFWTCIPSTFFSLFIKIWGKPLNFEYRKLTPNKPILFNSKPTGVRFAYDTFKFAVIDQLKFGRSNTDYPRSLIVRTFERGKVIKRTIRPEDCVLLNIEGEVRAITPDEIMRLES